MNRTTTVLLAVIAALLLGILVVLYWERSDRLGREQNQRDRLRYEAENGPRLEPFSPSIPVPPGSEF